MIDVLPDNTGSRLVESVVRGISLEIAWGHGEDYRFQTCPVSDGFQNGEAWVCTRKERVGPGLHGAWSMEEWGW